MSGKAGPTILLRNNHPPALQIPFHLRPRKEPELLMMHLLQRIDRRQIRQRRHPNHNRHPRRRQWQRGILERVGAGDGWNARWTVVGW